MKFCLNVVKCGHCRLLSHIVVTVKSARSLRDNHTAMENDLSGRNIGYNS